MKYPQLVSNRAVREISDWLIKRLEDLDIEQPGVYSRLLLSLLHTPFKVNAIDLLEIPQLKDLKQPYHLLNKNNEELKRLAAVESLMEVSAEENKSNIVSLVDELHLKLRKIENSCEEGGSAASIIGRSIAPTSPTSSGSKFYKNLKKIKRNHGAENPTKNYYLAFPALSSNKTTATTTITSGGVKRSSPGEVETKKDSKELQLTCWSSLMTKDNSPAKEVKRPRKKRRYGRHKSAKNDVQCNAKIYDGATFSPKVQNGSKKHQRNQFVATTKNPKVDRNNHFAADFPATGSAPWDMDFKGHWEMDRDLISEFKNPATSATKQVDDDDDMMLRFLPTRLMDDDPIGDKIVVKAKEAQSISSLESKFDENVKALWKNVDDPVGHKSFDDGGSNASLVSSFASEKNSLSLFNFAGHQTQQHHLEVIAPAGSMQEFDRGAMNHHFYSSESAVISPAGTEKFIKAGTNLQMSIWSDGEPESLIFKDVVDHCGNDDAIYKQMRSIGTEVRNWPDEDASDVSLFNHSEASAFKRFRPLAAAIIHANYHPINFDRPLIVDPSTDDDNLLTSERSHFSPIIDDGHTFIIDDHWDEIKWERSPSGGLMHNNKHYMKFRAEGLDLDAMEDEVETEFTVKFVVQVENEKACQTDLNDFLRASHRSLMEINEEYCKRKIYDEYCRGVVDNKWRYHLEDSNDYSLFTQVKSSAPKTLQDMLLSSNSSSSSICTITSSSYDQDPFESWRSKTDRSNMLDAKYKKPCIHSMWEQCITCDPYEEKSIPADDQLKDELRLDGDEIMNVIQNLYITGDFCEEEKEEDDCTDMNHFYVDMLDDSMDDSKFYEEKLGKDQQKVKLTPDMFEQLPLEKFDEIAKYEKTRKEQEKCMQMLSFFLLQKPTLIHDANNNCEWFDDDHYCNRKRRHSTCQNLMEMKMSQCRQSPALIEDNCAKKMMKIMLVSNETGEFEKKDEGKNYYRNILQQQHALIKSLDLARPLTR